MSRRISTSPAPFAEDSKIEKEKKRIGVAMLASEGFQVDPFRRGIVTGSVVEQRVPMSIAKRPVAPPPKACLMPAHDGQEDRPS
jgi:hypothetical protein